ncbi:SOS response-associated peptidase [Allopusillimonas ginsengisoli]|uniref:SOS response-associated peptidase n=1 Tax=Allopusillimonas ginsengisoli TaxID=453575 RepID=UPI0039C1C017
MCGRVKQTNDPAQYFDYTRWNPLVCGWDDYRASPNVPPGTRPLVLHRLGGGAEQANTLFWGYKPPWPGYTRGPASNARLDTVLKGSRFWKPLLTKRIIVPVDGWYEWTGEKGDKQPWFINPKDGHPILMAGITAWHPGQELLAENGFAIITDDAAGGMVDIHDRRPICLGIEDALAWLDPKVPVDQALELLSTARPESAFQWWEVTRKMGNSRYQIADSSEPL